MSKEEIIKEFANKITDYGYNDEYGYYSDWKDGVEPILRSFYDRVRLKTIKKNFPYSVSEWTNIGKERGYWNYFRGETIKEVEDIIDKNIAIHIELESQWTGLTVSGHIESINPHTERKQELLKIKNSLNKLK